MATKAVTREVMTAAQISKPGGDFEVDPSFQSVVTSLSPATAGCLIRPIPSVPTTTFSDSGGIRLANCQLDP